MMGDVLMVASSFVLGMAAMAWIDEALRRAVEHAPTKPGRERARAYLESRHARRAACEGRAL
jgi:hypothetical protein